MVTEEEIRRMNPEQILQLQKQNCIFCQIVSGRVPAKNVYETPALLGLLDINPANPGHVILLTKEHYQIMPLIPDDAIGELFIGAKIVSQAILKSLQAQGTTIFAASGTVAGQRAPHFMLHIIPRTEGDGVGIEIPARNASHAAVSKRLSAKIREAFGATEEETPGKGAEESDAEVEKAPEKSETGRKGSSHVNLDELTDFMSKGKNG